MGFRRMTLTALAMKGGDGKVRLETGGRKALTDGSGEVSENTVSSELYNFGKG